MKTLFRAVVASAALLLTSVAPALAADSCALSGTYAGSGMVVEAGVTYQAEFAMSFVPGGACDGPGTVTIGVRDTDGSLSITENLYNVEAGTIVYIGIQDGEAIQVFLSGHLALIAGDPALALSVALVGYPGASTQVSGVLMREHVQ